MKIKCEYCGKVMNNYDVRCPYCNSLNNYFVIIESFNQNPKTIDELKQWYIDNNLPPENTTRFFIGTNYKGARAFGIYQDEETEEFIVYKNKSDGSRTIRYRGKNEAYAVNELYLKVKEEIANQKENNRNKSNSVYRNRSNNSYKSRYSNYYGKRFELFNFNQIFSIIIILILLISFILAMKSPKRGYYLYNDDYYYYQNGSWYEYDRYRGWNSTYIPTDFKDNYKDYYQSYNYNNYYDINSFESSSYYEEPSSSSSDSDDSFWDDDDSWDSSSTDWDSDW